MLALFVLLNLFLREKLGSAESACKLTRMNADVIHIILKLFIALEAKLFEIFNRNFVHAELVMSGLNLRDEVLRAFKARISVSSFLLSQSAVLLHVSLKQCGRLVMGGAFRTRIARRSINVDEVLLHVQVLNVR